MESQTELGKLREKKDKRDGARGAVTEQRWSTHTMLAHTCAHSVFFLLFFCPWNAHIQKKNGRRDYSLLVPSFPAFIPQPSVSSSFFFYRHTHLFSLPPPPPPPFLWRTRSIAAHVGKLLCRHSHCFSSPPWFRELSTVTAVERMSARDWERDSGGEGGGMKETSEGGRGDVEMEVPTEGRGSNGMLVSLCPSKRCNSSGKGRWWREK